MSQDPEFTHLMRECATLAETFPDGLVFIGGIAIYLHAVNQAKTQSLAETTYDADFYLSMSEMVELREEEDLVANRRLRKHQMTKKGFAFDIYTERQSGLQVPYDEVLAHSRAYDTFKVASLEHLLVLKLAAYEDRRGSSKGAKDARDILRLASVAETQRTSLNPALVWPYWQGEELALLEEIQKGPEAAALAHGNAMEAKGLRLSMRHMLDTLIKAGPGISGETPSANPPRSHRRVR